MHPEYREVLATYAQHQGMPVEEFGYVADDRPDRSGRPRSQNRRQTAAVIMQSPNFFGIVEKVNQAAADSRTSTARC